MLEFGGNDLSRLFCINTQLKYTFLPSKIYNDMSYILYTILSNSCQLISTNQLNQGISL